MSIQDNSNVYGENMKLSLVRLDIDFSWSPTMGAIMSECKKYLSKNLGYKVSDVNKKTNNDVLMEKLRGGIIYTITLKGNVFSLVAQIHFVRDIENVLREIKKVTKAFVDIVSKKNKNFYISNVLFIKGIDSTDKDINEEYRNRTFVADKGISMEVMTCNNKDWNLLLRSYFLRSKDIENFRYNIDSSIDSLYKISI